MSEYISINDLERAVRISARVVALYGETYLPIFNRLHSELILEKSKQDQNSLALQIALNYNKGI